MPLFLAPAEGWGALRAPHIFVVMLQWPISPPIAYRFGWNFHSVVSVVHVTGTVGVSHHMSHHTSQMSQTTEINPGPLVWHHFGNVTTPASTWDWNTCHRACNVLHHTSHVTHHMSQITRNRLGPLVWHHFGNVTTPALTWDWNTCHRACHVSHHTSRHISHVTKKYHMA